MDNIKRAKRDWKAKERVRKEGTHRNIGINVDYYYKVEDNHLYIFCEQSKQWTDWVTDFIFFPTKRVWGGMKRWYHRGFLYTAETIYEGLGKDVTGVEHCTIYGYSLGGAATQILADMFKYLSDIRVEKVVTFGTPRNMLKTKDNSLVRSRKNYFRYTQGKDLVSRLPPWPYVHFGKNIQLPGTGNSIKDHDYNYLSK